MISRRNFNKLAGFFVASPFILKTIPAALAGLKDSSPLEKYFIYERGAIKGDIEQLLAENFHKIYAIKGDVTRVWYDDLYFRWKDGEIATLGLTRESEFFVLQTLARDYGYKTEYRELQPELNMLFWSLVPADFSGR
ncbi:MAG: hypothetical protein KDI20_04775 [Pseudomonadales bacterium]|nr:hypothetical protein [Pseudomonadales bacterium]